MSLRDRAIELLEAHVESPSLRKHCVAVATALKWYAAKLGQDADLWEAVGLLHDFDYEKHPEEHPPWGMLLLGELGWSEEIIRAIGSHNEKLGIERISLLEKHLFACDELAGFVVAVTYVRPSKSIFEVEVSSVLKKLRQSGFAAAVDRSEIEHGAQEIGLSLDQHIGNVIAALQGEAEALGLEGLPPGG